VDDSDDATSSGASDADHQSQPDSPSGHGEQAGDTASSTPPQRAPGQTQARQRTGRNSKAYQITGATSVSITESSPGDSRSHKWVIIGVVIAAAALAVAFLTYLATRNEAAPASQGGGVPAVANGPERDTPTAIAQIVNTGADGFVYAYAGPDDSEESTKSNGTWPEGESVTIVCQERAGRIISDPAYPGGPVSSPVWNRIASPGPPTFIPDIYTNLPKATDDKPPAGLPTCTDYAP
jgi:hypothetical protein